MRKFNTISASGRCKNKDSDYARKVSLLSVAEKLYHTRTTPILCLGRNSKKDPYLMNQDQTTRNKLISRVSLHNFYRYLETRRGSKHRNSTKQLTSYVTST